MRVAIPSETKQREYRVALTPAGARELTDAGHEVFVQAEAGAGSGFSDSAYRAAGAQILPGAEAAFDAGELILQVKEPQPEEISLLDERHLLFAFLHLAADLRLADALAASGATCIAYETVEDDAGQLPLLTPMSEIAGKIAAQVSAFHLFRHGGGRGLLIGGVPGVSPASVLVIGGGTSGANAAAVARGLGARVTVLDRDLNRLRQLDETFRGGIEVVFSSRLEIEERLPHADVVIGAVLVRGAQAPHVLRRGDLEKMKPGAVLVDISIDQGGCFESSHPTTHDDPIFILDRVAHYCVTNIPGDVPETSTRALTNATLPYVLRLCELGLEGAFERDPGFALGLNLAGGYATYAPVAAATGIEYRDPELGDSRRVRVPH